MTLNDMNTIDKVAMLASTGLMFLGVVVLGLIEVIAGKPYGAAPLTNDAGDVIATPTVDPNIRTGLVVAALVILLLWAVYKLASPTPPADEATATERTAQ